MQITRTSSYLVLVILVASIAALTISQILHEVEAKSYSPRKFSVYENSDYKIRILYPADWKVSETGLSSYGIAEFSAKEVEEEVSSLHTVIYVPARVYIFAEPVKNSNWTLNDYFKDLMKTAYTSNREYKILNTSSATLAGLPALTSLLYDYKDDSTSKVMRTIAIANDTVYRISYYSDPGKFSEYLPTVTEMINSFQINYTPTESLSNQQNASEISPYKELVSNVSSPETLTNTGRDEGLVSSNELNLTESSDLSSKETSILNDQSSYTDENPKLAITNFKLVTDDTDSSIIGEVMNNTTDPINSIHITSSVYNLKNQLIATGDTTTDIDQLRPGEKTGFEISLSSKVSGGKRVTVSSEYQVSDSLKPGFLKVTVGKLDKDNRPYSDYEDFTVVGQVTNLGPETTSSIKVAGLFFDKKHNLVDYDYHYLKSDQLNSGQMAPFEISIFSKNAGKIDSVSLNVQGDEYSMAIENKQK